MSAKKILLNWIAKDNLPLVLQRLSFLADQYKDEQLRSRAIFQSGRLHALEKQRMNGFISQEEDGLEIAKIRTALLQIVQDLPETWTFKGVESHRHSHVAPSDTNWKKYTAYVVVAIALLVGISVLSGVRLKDLFRNKETTEIPEQILPPAPKVSSQGDNSPAVITKDGDVNINYGTPSPEKDTSHTKEP